MQIAKTNLISAFGSIKIAPYLDSSLQKSIALKNAKKAEKLLTKLGLGKEKNINIIIGEPFWHRKTGIAASIESKKQGQPINPYSEMLVPSARSKKKINDFISWVKDWDYRYSKAGLRKYKALERKLFEVLKNKK